LTCVYGNPNPSLRHLVWERLERTATTRTGPWTAIGDFNEIKNNNEKRGGPRRPESSFMDFRRMLQICDFEDLKHFGDPFSWIGKRYTHDVACCLDRTLVNNEWLAEHPASHSEFLEFIESDHRPVITTISNDFTPRQGQFYFDSRMIGQDGFNDAVKMGWKLRMRGHHEGIGSRLKNCRTEISKWKRRYRRSGCDEIVLLKHRLDKAHSVGSSTQQLRDLRLQLTRAYENEEEFWRIKSRKTWLSSGERNTQYFFASAKTRAAKNRLISLIDDHGTEHRGDTHIGVVAEQFFTKLFESDLNPQNNHYHVLHEFQTRVTPEMNANLIKPVSEEEIKQAVFSIGSTKAPGPDGFTGAFFQQYWEDIKTELIEEVQNFFEHGSFDKSLNHTNICLIPKTSEAKHLSEYRPIALCNVSYKVISRVLVERLQRHLSSIISEEQAAFIPGRVITDNVLIAHEVIHALKVKKRCANSFLAIKTDITKAYDRLEWDFLQATMFRFGFDVKWIKWIMTCVRTTTYSVNINGAPHGFIEPKRGIRQGDPLSPYLFILCAEVLSHMMKRAERNGAIKGIKISNGGPAISHLLFADDSLFFCQANKKSVQEIKSILYQYEQASGQKVNTRKSAITFGKRVSEATKTQIRRCLQILNDGGCSKYLGMPEQFGRKKVELFQYIVEKVRERTNGWSNKFLSQGGKEVLLKSIAIAMPVYCMNCFKLPRSICDEIERLMANYWWQTNRNDSPTHWVAWDRLKHLKKEGGLGFRDIEKFNESMLAKQAWRILQNPSCLLARVLKGRYFSSSNILTATRGSRPSFGWQSILLGRDLLKRGLRFTIGNDTTIQPWVDPWLPIHPPRPPRLTSPTSITRVNELFLHHQAAWNETLIRAVVHPDDVSHILRIKISSHQDKDYLGWHYSDTGIYSVRSGYWLAMHLPDQEVLPLPPHGDPQLKQSIWKTKTAPKIKHFLWKLLSRGLPTGEELERRHMITNGPCRRCVTELETTHHLFFTCPHATMMWRASHVPIRSIFDPVVSLEAKIRAILDFNNQKDTSNHLTHLPLWILWKLWRSRNILTFQQRSSNWQKDLREAKQDATEWSSLLLPSSHNRHTTHTGHQTRVVTSKTWKRPRAGLVKCNYDGGFLNSEQSVTTGWVLRDDDGDYKGSAQSTGFMVTSAVEAECQSLITAMQHLWTKGYRRIIFEGDSKILVSVLQSNSMRFDLFNWLKEIKHWQARFEEVEYAWVPRTANAPADKLARHQRLSQTLFTFHNLIPSCLSRALYSDSINQ